MDRGLVAVRNLAWIFIDFPQSLYCIMERSRTRPRDRLIRFRKRDTLEMCGSPEAPNRFEQRAFRGFCQLLQSLFGLERHASPEALQNKYTSLNPVHDNRKVGVFPSDTGDDYEKQLALILDKANYKQNETVASWFGLRKKSVRFGS